MKKKIKLLLIINILIDVNVVEFVYKCSEWKNKMQWTRRSGMIRKFRE